jgi:hypothetical protein
VASIYHKNVSIKQQDTAHNHALYAGVHPQFFLGGWRVADPEVIYNLCLNLKIVLQKSCCKYNIPLLATAPI